MKRLWYFALSFFVLAVGGGGLYRALAQQPPQSQEAVEAQKRAEDEVTRRKHVMEVYKRNEEKLRQNPDIFGVSFRDDHIVYSCVGSAGALLTTYCGLEYEPGNRHLSGMSGALVVHDISGDVVGEHTGGTYESLNPP